MEPEIAGLRDQATALAAEREVLLQMVGERDEEVEGLRADLEEVRHSYRAQLEALMGGQGDGGLGAVSGAVAAAAEASAAVAR